jgi:hypothetical protein
MLASSIRSRTVANKWLTFLRKHYQPEPGSTVHTTLQLMMEPTPYAEVAAALKGFVSTCSSVNRVEASLVFRLLGVVYDVCVRAPPHPSLWLDVIAASQCATLALTDASSAQSASEHKVHSKRERERESVCVCVCVFFCATQNCSLNLLQETALLITVHMLGRWAAVSSPPNSQWYEHLRPVLDAMPHGLGSCCSFFVIPF